MDLGFGGRIWGTSGSSGPRVVIAETGLVRKWLFVISMGKPLHLADRVLSRSGPDGGPK